MQYMVSKNSFVKQKYFFGILVLVIMVNGSVPIDSVQPNVTFGVIRILKHSMVKCMTIKDNAIIFLQRAS